MQNLEGLKFGRFKIEKLLGVGGFAVVYKAIDLEKLAETFAIKILANHWSKKENVVREFIRGGEIAARLDHPHIIKVYEVGRVYGQPYNLMEFCEGSTLTDLLDSSTSNLDPEKICYIFRQIAGALDYLHEKRLIHRDIKPSNILVAPDLSVKLVDFGLALELVGVGLREDTGIGTLRYMSPEQARGDALGPGSDVYSLGRVVKEILDSLKIPSSTQVQAAIDKALDDNPRRRPTSASDFIQDICLSLGRKKHEVTS